MQWLEAILAAPADPDPLCGLASVLQDLGEYAQALPLWQQAEQLAPATIEILMAQGKCLEQLGLDSEATALAERACAAFPARAEPFRLLGFMLCGLACLPRLRRPGYRRLSWSQTMHSI